MEANFTLYEILTSCYSKVLSGTFIILFSLALFALLNIKALPLAWHVRLTLLFLLPIIAF